ncbi:MAG: diacylglycerol kinase (ATP) [Bacteroidia bacterium]|jgi:diacylglycerol kinase (ATP)
MSEKQHLLFVVNPISGGKSKARLPDTIKKCLNHTRFSYEIYLWEIIDDLPRAISAFVSNNGYAVVVVGGDGTINAVASNLVNSSVRLAIIPQGSGNGFAREFNISRSVDKALRQLNNATEQVVDMGKMNGQVFVNVGGWGFDAKVSNTFAQLTKRGFWSYAIAIYKDFGGAQNLIFTVEGNAETFTKEGFMLTIANGRQWGNNFFVAPKASFNDGLLDLVFLIKPKGYQIPLLVLCLYFRLPNRLITRKQIQQAMIKSNKPCYTHLDGEPVDKVGEVSVEVVPNALKVLA